MTRFARRAAGFISVLLVSGPALASPCSQEIDALSGRVREEGREAISASTGGKSVAAAREGQGQAQGKADGAGAPAVREAPPEKSAEAGKGAEQAQSAKVALDEARTLDDKGDAKGCADAVARAKASLNKAP